MATFFGEIVPSFSRAVDDDDDDIDSEYIETTSVRWSPVVQAERLTTPDQKVPCQTLVIAIGPAAAGFVQAYILTEQFYVVGALFSGMSDNDVNTFDQTAPSDKTCYIYRSRSNDQAYLCLCKTDVSDEQCYSWADQLFSCLSTDSPSLYASILCSTMLSEYRSDVPVSELETPFLRALKTGRFAGTPVCPFLEQPNLLSGLAAQLLTVLQARDVKAVLYVCYTDCLYLDSETMAVFRPLLKTTPIKDIYQGNTKAEEVMRHIVDSYSLKNSLYM
ncbi:proteasome assembly chaperone 1-like [Mya arenaria]|uniref:proteasome assembly chaperone 1-like n=1 Tax=Mya arenaria TaxID=6604 RepID=UPI0022E767FE|nr:proteasome assembly chaperone 1-like [Mya arenaria]